MARKPFSPSEIDSRSIVGNNPVSRMAIIVLTASMLLGLVLILSGFGTRWGWWHYTMGFDIMRWTAIFGAFMLVMTTYAFFRVKNMKSRRGTPLAALGLCISVVLVAVPTGLHVASGIFPAIHDVSTDTENPPEFVDVTSLRSDADRTPEYGVRETAAIQHEHYPEINSFTMNQSYNRAFELALQAAGDMRGWEVISYDRAEGRIEATDRTVWFGFEDDVVVRVQEKNGITLIDVRSKARVERKNPGIHARRINRYLNRISRAE